VSAVCEHDTGTAVECRRATAFRRRAKLWQNTAASMARYADEARARVAELEKENAELRGDLAKPRCTFLTCWGDDTGRPQSDARLRAALQDALKGLENAYDEGDTVTRAHIYRARCALDAGQGGAA
jgi:hypothetical protein